MNISKLLPHMELIASVVHDALWREKVKQGFHPPLECPKPLIEPKDTYDDLKFHHHCEMCHADMYPYDELPGNIKEYDRVTVRAVLTAIGNI